MQIISLSPSICYVSSVGRWKNSINISHRHLSASDKLFHSSQTHLSFQTISFSFILSLKFSLVVLPSSFLQHVSIVDVFLPQSLMIFFCSHNFSHAFLISCFSFKFPLKKVNGLSGRYIQISMTMFYHSFSSNLVPQHIEIKCVLTYLI